MPANSYLRHVRVGARVWSDVESSDLSDANSITCGIDGADEQLFNCGSKQHTGALVWSSPAETLYQ
jgi:hypothetical protein